jgi:hypothetical protein
MIKLYELIRLNERVYHPWSGQLSGIRPKRGGRLRMRRGMWNYRRLRYGTDSMMNPNGGRDGLLGLDPNFSRIKGKKKSSQQRHTSRP